MSRSRVNTNAPTLAGAGTYAKGTSHGIITHPIITCEVGKGDIEQAALAAVYRLILSPDWGKINERQSASSNKGKE